MKTNLRKNDIAMLGALLAAASLIAVAGCASHALAPKRSGFLSHYHNLQKVDDNTWRFINPSRLALYNKFQITAAEVLVTAYDGQPVSADTKQKVTSYLREAVTKALSDRYPVVSAGGVDVADIRVALTDAYKTGNRLGLTVEGEIMDSYSTYQAAAVMRTELGKVYLGDWWDSTSAKELIDAWAGRLRDTIDVAHNLNPAEPRASLK